MGFIVIDGNATADASARVHQQAHRAERADPDQQRHGHRQRPPLQRRDRRLGGHRRTFYEVTVSGEQATRFASSASKGTRLLIAGNVYVEEYRDTEGGQRQRQRISTDHHGLSTKYAPAGVPETVTH